MMMMVVIVMVMVVVVIVVDRNQQMMDRMINRWMFTYGMRSRRLFMIRILRL